VDGHASADGPKHGHACRYDQHGADDEHVDGSDNHRGCADGGHNGAGKHCDCHCADHRNGCCSNGYATADGYGDATADGDGNGNAGTSPGYDGHRDWLDDRKHDQLDRQHEHKWYVEHKWFDKQVRFNEQTDQEDRRRRDTLTEGSCGRRVRRSACRGVPGPAYRADTAHSRVARRHGG
jgi:hypothetical protein